MASKLLNFSRQSLISHFRHVHTSTTVCGIFDFLKKPVGSPEDMATGYQKIILEAKKVGEDALDSNTEINSVEGSGTKSDPFIVPSRNTRRYVLVEPPNHHGGPWAGFWVTLEDGGRCPITAQYYKLDYQSEDKWGIDELDLFKH